MTYQGNLLSKTLEIAIIIMLIGVSIYPSILADYNDIESDDHISDIIQQINETFYLRYLEDIVAFGPRVTGTTACYDAGEYIYNEFKSMGLKVRYHYWDSSGYSDRNIEATLSGTDATSDEIYIICAHFDSVSNSPGADDDGSGVAAVLLAANILRQYTFDHTIRFVTFSGEEQWMLGSYKYVREANKDGDNIIAVLNCDMIGFAITSTHSSNIKLYSNVESNWIIYFTENISQIYYDYIKLNVDFNDPKPNGDHYYFWEYGYDGVLYQEYEFNEYYHTSQDTIENMNITYATKCSKLIVATLAILAQFDSNPPTASTIDGPTSGNAGTTYTFTFNSVDPDGDDIANYTINWGDGPYEVLEGPFISGSSVTANHTWTSQRTYKFMAMAKDKWGARSDWSYFEVTIPRTRAISNLWYQWFLERFPLLEKLLNLLK